MKILVPVKQVASLDEEFALSASGGVAERDLDRALNEWDAFSLEAAIELSEDGEGEVVVVSVGDDEAEEGLMSCLAKGADRAVRVWDEELAGLDPLGAGLDPLLVANLLAGVARRESPQLIMCGVQSSDAVNSATGVALAGLLDLPRVAVVNAIERDGERLAVQRELEGGTVELLHVPMPALLTVQTGINEPRYATLRAIKLARSKPLELLTTAELGIAPEQLRASAGAETVRLTEPQTGDGANLIEGDASAIAARIAELVREAIG